MAHGPQPLVRLGKSRFVGSHFQSLLELRGLLDGLSRLDRLQGPRGRLRGSKKKKGPGEAKKRERLGRSNGGITSKFHAIASSCGRLVDGVLTAGQAADAGQAPKLLDLALRRGPMAVCADKAYDINPVLEKCAARCVEIVIPNRSNRVIKRSVDPEKYRERNKVERLFQRLKQARRVCFRYDKKASAFMSWIWIFAALEWLAP